MPSPQNNIIRGETAKINKNEILSVRIMKNIYKVINFKNMKIKKLIRKDKKGIDARGVSIVMPGEYHL